MKSLWIACMALAVMLSLSMTPVMAQPNAPTHPNQGQKFWAARKAQIAANQKFWAQRKAKIAASKKFWRERDENSDAKQAFWKKRNAQIAANKKYWAAHRHTPK